MRKVEELLEARQIELQKLIKEKQAALQVAPEGKLRISCYDGKTRYYQRTNPKNFNGIYIKDENLELAKELAQKDYNQKVLTIMEREQKTIDDYLIAMRNIDYEKIYNELHVERQKLVNPLIIPDEEFIKIWESVEYTGKEFKEDSPEIYTLKGERVRSKSEMMIADTLNKMGIPYRYEYPVWLKGCGQVYTDFTVLLVKERMEKRWEHFGRMDEPDYANKTVNKINHYANNGIYIGEQLIVTFETKNHPLTQREIERTIKQYLY